MSYYHPFRQQVSARPMFTAPPTVTADPVWNNQGFDYYNHVPLYSTWNHDPNANPVAVNSNPLLIPTLHVDSGSTASPYATADVKATTSKPKWLLDDIFDWDAIRRKSLSVLMPFRSGNDSSGAIAQDSEIGGPFMILCALALLLLLVGKNYYYYVFGVAFFSCVLFHLLFNAMAADRSLSVSVTVSVLGYCLLPVVGLASVAMLFSLEGIIGFVLNAAAVLWCSLCASKWFATELQMEDRRALVAYPCAVVYAAFVLLVVF